jgi:hypothetical protein
MIDIKSMENKYKALGFEEVRLDSGLAVSDGDKVCACTDDFSSERETVKLILKKENKLIIFIALNGDIKAIKIENDNVQEIGNRMRFTNHMSNGNIFLSYDYDEITMYLDIFPDRGIYTLMDKVEIYKDGILLKSRGSYDADGIKFVGYTAVDINRNEVYSIHTRPQEFQVATIGAALNMSNLKLSIERGKELVIKCKNSENRFKIVYLFNDLEAVGVYRYSEIN